MQLFKFAGQDSLQFFGIVEAAVDVDAVVGHALIDEVFRYLDT